MTSSSSERSATRACWRALRGPALTGVPGSFTSPSSVSVPLEWGLSLPLELRSRDRLRLRCRRAAVRCRCSCALALLLSFSLHHGTWFHTFLVFTALRSMCSFNGVQQLTEAAIGVAAAAATSEAEESSSTAEENAGPLCAVGQIIAIFCYGIYHHSDRGKTATTQQQTNNSMQDKDHAP